MIATVSLETARRLKDAGFRQNTIFLWASWSTGTQDMDNVVEFREFLEWRKKREHGVKEQVWDAYAAPTTDELLTKIPEEYDGGSLAMTRKSVYYEIYEPYEPAYVKHCFGGSNLVEALANCWLYLKQEGLIEAKS